MAIEVGVIAVDAAGTYAGGSVVDATVGAALAAAM
jgi:hypothetical protein